MSVAVLPVWSKSASLEFQFRTFCAFLWLCTKFAEQGRDAFPS